MRLRLPPPPRKVRLRQIPGALPRIGAVIALGLTGMALCAAGERAALRRAREEQQGFARRIAVEGQIARVRRDGHSEVVAADVLYQVEGRQFSAAGLEVESGGRALGPGAALPLRVDPRRPDSPLEAQVARREEGRVFSSAWGWAALGLCALLGSAGWAAASARAERRALREGLLVWATPDPEHPEIHFGRMRAHYFRQDVRQRLWARARAGRAPIRNGDKVLAAAVPGRPRLAWIVDEALARSLGWVED